MKIIYLPMKKMHQKNRKEESLIMELIVMFPKIVQ